ncbi:hypothetical protein T492DRAFT_1095910 [Pavlovales sp. CCMP2436]|nr:hypothetical protein T492DRAFT_1095910 [Pavlovales sp. CCMP2436]
MLPGARGSRLALPDSVLLLLLLPLLRVRVGEAVGFARGGRGGVGSSRRALGPAAHARECKRGNGAARSRLDER